MRPITSTSERGRHRDGDLREADDDPRALERPVQPGEKPGIERLGVRGRHVGEEAERPARRRASSRTCRSSRRTPRGCRPARSRARRGAGCAAAAATHDDGAAWYPLRDAAHDDRTVRSGLVPRRTTSRRQRVGSVRPLAGAAPGRYRGRGADATARRRAQASWTRSAGSPARARPSIAARSATTRTSRARRTRDPPAEIPRRACAARARGSASTA